MKKYWVWEYNKWVPTDEPPIPWSRTLPMEYSYDRIHWYDTKEELDEKELPSVDTKLYARFKE